MTDIIDNIIKYLPAVEEPIGVPSATDRLKTLFFALLIFFFFYNTPAIGTKMATGGLDFMQMIVASRWGSLMTLGIGPLVFASLLMLVLKGMGALKLDPADPIQRQKYLGIQKILGILMAFFQGFQFAFSPYIVVMQDTPLVRAFVAIQFALASVIILFIDEAVTKYGLGSGIGLFIAAGVSYMIFAGAVGLFIGPGGVLDIVAEGGATVFAEVLKTLIPLISTIVIFLTVAYVEGIKIRIPLLLPGYGAGRRFHEIPLLYVSNIPVIFATGLLFYVQFFGAALSGIHHPLVKYIAVVDNGRIVDGLLYLITPVYVGRGLFANYEYLLSGHTPVLGIPEWFHALVYLLFLMVVSAWIGLIWIEGTQAGPADVAEMLASRGMGIRGMRVSKKILQKKLEEYIPIVTVIGSAFVGLLAGMANLTGALGTGTGVLLTVGIIYRMYLQAKQQGVIDNLKLPEWLQGVLVGA